MFGDETRLIRSRGRMGIVVRMEREGREVYRPAATTKGVISVLLVAYDEKGLRPLFAALRGARSSWEDFLVSLIGALVH